MAGCERPRPAFFFIDHKGMIRHKWIGKPGKNSVHAALDQLILETESAAAPRCIDGLSVDASGRRFDAHLSFEPLRVASNLYEEHFVGLLFAFSQKQQAFAAGDPGFVVADSADSGVAECRVIFWNEDAFC